MELTKLKEAHYIVDVVSHGELCVEWNAQIQYSVIWKHSGSANRQR